MIYESVEVFRKQAGLTPSLDTHENDVSQCVLLNFERDEEAGGYISLRLEKGFVHIECFNAHNDIFQEITLPCSVFKPMRGRV
jgi:hypothetical protein